MSMGDMISRANSNRKPGAGINPLPIFSCMPQKFKLFIANLCHVVMGNDLGEHALLAHFLMGWVWETQAQMRNTMGSFFAQEL